MKIEPVCRPADGEELKTFIMYYPDAEARKTNMAPDITVRGSTASYSEFTAKSRPRIITIGPVLYKMDFCSMSEAILAFAINGIRIDFIETFHTDGWDERLTSFIDMRKASPEKAGLIADFPRYYVVSTRNSLPYAVVDRFAQNAGIDFVSGKFDRKAICCRFKRRKDASDWCGMFNKHSVLARK